MKIMVTQRYFLCLMHLLLGITSYGAESGSYESASVTPYYTDDTGKTYFLLGKETREGSDYWYNFGGNKDAADIKAAMPLKIEPSLFTAQREAQEETAGQILFKKDALVPVKPWYMAANPETGFWIQEKKPDGNHSVGYFLPIMYSAPEKIKQAARKLTGGKAAHLEKNDWQWVDAQDFLDWIKKSKMGDYNYPLLNSPIFPMYKVTLSMPKVQEYIQLIIDAGKKVAIQKAGRVPESIKPLVYDIQKILLNHRKRPSFTQWYDQFDNKYEDRNTESDYHVLGQLRVKIEVLGPEEANFIDTYLRDYDVKFYSSPGDRETFINLVTPIAVKILTGEQFNNVQVQGLESEFKFLEKLSNETAKTLKTLLNKKKKK